MHHNNAPAHCAANIEFLPRNDVVISYPLYSLDLSLHSFYSEIKNETKGGKDSSLWKKSTGKKSKNKTKPQEALDRMTKDDCRNCFPEREKHWDECIASQKKYSEGE